MSPTVLRGLIPSPPKKKFSLESPDISIRQRGDEQKLSEAYTTSSKKATLRLECTDSGLLSLSRHISDHELDSTGLPRRVVAGRRAS